VLVGGRGGQRVGEPGAVAHGRRAARDGAVGGGKGVQVQVVIAQAGDQRAASALEQGLAGTTGEGWADLGDTAVGDPDVGDPDVGGSAVGGAAVAGAAVGGSAVGAGVSAQLGRAQ